ncbi:glycosyltransferase family 2 protein [Brevundimonas diminuta]|uniref:glycosyltransferase n=1 Tax=Brevundimonas diminuta TaxID=293 RepID=UPI001907159C|nr:glycosyltransferase family A protein [Brevundimonas diminuta]MBK1970595.1 glycosyltransferase family 2 protein [Brevundimonas diminuta]MBK1976970.1 glycosyltransferase family 2 protein [Brevundimonas diminuta]
MKIAILDGFPNLINSAEAEFIRRFEIACQNLGNVEAKGVSCSQEVYDYDPDAVLISHEFSRKLTSYPTLGLMWSPLSFFEEEKYRNTSVRTYDGYIVANDELENYCTDIQFGRPIQKPISKTRFLPTSYETDIVALQSVKQPSLCYMGVHWDGGRHNRVFDALSQTDFITFYGPKKSWERHAHKYGGMIPFDGRSVQKTLAQHGIALCFHKREHLRQNTPSMRLFEALSVGAIPICDNIEFAKTELADIALFVDTSKSADRIVKQIEAHVQWVQDHREEAIARVLKGKAWFSQNWSLETKIRQCIIPTIKETRKVGLFDAKPRAYKATISKTAPLPASKKPKCEIIIRTGGREIDTLHNAVQSAIAADSKDFPLGLIIVDYKKRSDIRKYVEEKVAPHIPVKYINCENTGYRSTAMWAGLRAVEAPFTAHLDDDDTVYPNHYRQLNQALKQAPNAPMAYSGVIKKEDSKGFYFSAPNFDGPGGKTIKEDREICFFSDHDLTRLTQFDNYIQSNTWMARTSLLQSVIGEDPRLVVCEDVYLYLLLAQHGPFKFTFSPTAAWHWRSEFADNSMNSVGGKIWMRDSRRVVRRLQNLSYFYAPDLESAKLLKPPPPLMINAGANADDTDELINMSYDAFIEPSEFADYFAFSNFHVPEGTGAWTRETDAHIKLKLDDEVIERGGAIYLDVMLSHKEMVQRRAYFSVNDGEKTSLSCDSWTTRTIRLDIPAGSPKLTHINLDIDSMYYPENKPDVRHLGIYVKSVALAENHASYLRAMASMSHEGNLRALYYEEPVYRHVEGISQIDSAVRYFKIQKYEKNYSIEVELANLRNDESIPIEYIDQEKLPVFRIYFNGDLEDIKRRTSLLPERIRTRLQIILDPQERGPLAMLHGEDRIKTHELLEVARKNISHLL